VRSGCACFSCCPRALADPATNETSLDRHPLQPADTTSPQATMRSFQENAREVVRGIRDRLPPAEVDRAVAKMMATLSERTATRRARGPGG
jgi:hypothetical protein